MMDYGWMESIKPIPEFPESFRFDRFERNGKTFGRLAQDVQWQTAIKDLGFRYAGFRTVAGVELWISFELFPDGALNGYSGTEYDFGSGPAINNLPVIYSSLKHDMGCHLTNLGLILWKFRAWFDKFYRQDLQAYGCPPIRAWAHWSAVRSNSKFVAYWKAEKHGAND